MRGHVHRTMVRQRRSSGNADDWEGTQSLGKKLQVHQHASSSAPADAAQAPRLLNIRHDDLLALAANGAHLPARNHAYSRCISTAPCARQTVARRVTYASWKISTRYASAPCCMARNASGVHSNLTSPHVYSFATSRTCHAITCVRGAGAGAGACVWAGASAILDTMQVNCTHHPLERCLGDERLG